MIVRLYLSGQLSPLTGEAADEAATKAQQTGVPYVFEVYDPSAPPAEAYSRFGNDRALLAVPPDIPIHDKVSRMLGRNR